MSAPRYQVLEAIQARVAAALTPPPALIRIGYISYQTIHAWPAVFITIGPGPTTSRQQHSGGAWEHRFIVRITWVVRGSDVEPLEARGLLIHDQILNALAKGDRTLGGLCFDMKPVNDLGHDQGELALSGTPIGPFYQDVIVSLMVSP
jgi:hypothetical protein